MNYFFLDFLSGLEDLVQIAVPAGGVIACSIFQDLRGIQHVLNALPDSGCRLRLGPPDGRENRRDMTNVDVRYGQIADDGMGIGLQRVLPLILVLCVLPAGLL